MVLNELLFKLYNVRRTRLHSFIIKAVGGLEKGELYSETLRKIFSFYHDVEIGMYTMGGCFVPGQFDRFTKIGRYCSIARQVRAVNRNHPLDFISTSALFFNPVLKQVETDPVSFHSLEIGNDVWIGHNAFINPIVRTIGTGAVIGAGAVVSINVPPYAIVVGNPARVVRYRFPKDVIEEFLVSKWWEKPIEEIDIEIFQKPYLLGKTQSHIKDL
jgi:virginiamycin A acetyltransferase